MDWNVLLHHQHPPSPRFLWRESSKPSHHRNTFTCSLIKQTCWAQWMFLNWIVFPNMSKNTGKFRGVQSATELQALQMAERFCDRSQPPRRAAPLSGSVPVPTRVLPRGNALEEPGQRIAGEATRWKAQQAAKFDPQLPRPAARGQHP